MKKPLEITIGSGDCFIGLRITKDNKKGIRILQNIGKHEIGSKHTGWEDSRTAKEKESDVILWFESLDSARVLQDIVSALVLSLQNVAVVDLDTLEPDGNDTQQGDNHE